MKKTAACFLLLFLAAAGLAQFPRSEAQVRASLAERLGVPVESADFFRTAPAKTAWEGFQYVSILGVDGDESFLKRAGRAIAENSEVEVFAKKGTAKLPADFLDDNGRSYYLWPLGDIPAPWSLRILGRYLIDDTPLTREPDNSDYGGTHARSIALVCLSRMGFFDAPNRERMPNVTPESMKAWRKWWKENEGRVEQRIHEINPGYVPPVPKSTPVAEPPAVTATPPSRTVSTMPSPTVPKPAVRPMTAATPAPSKKTPETGISIYVVGGLLALGALGAIAWAARRK